MNKLAKILIVDDDKFISGPVAELFSREFDTVAVNDGEEAIAEFSKGEFSLVLLDVNMPEMDGYEVCKRIKEIDAGGNIPVIFLSGKKSVEDIIKGYDCGCSDYITKPFQFEVLYNRVKREIYSRRDSVEFKNNLDSVTETMLSIQSDNSKIYDTARFLQKSHSCNDLKSLCDNLFSVTNSFGTRATLYIHTDQNDFFISDSGEERDISNRVLETLKNERRIFEFGETRSVFNWKSASLLVENVQNDIDNLALLMDGFEVGVRTIESIDKFHDILAEYRKQNHLLNINVANVVEDLVISTHDKLASIGASAMLTIEHEDALKQIANEHLDEVDQLFANNLKTDEQFSSIIGELRATDEDSSSIIDDDGIAFF